MPRALSFTLHHLHELGVGPGSNKHICSRHRRSRERVIFANSPQPQTAPITKIDPTYLRTSIFFCRPHQPSVLSSRIRLPPRSKHIKKILKRQLSLLYDHNHERGSPLAHAYFDKASHTEGPASEDVFHMLTSRPSDAAKSLIALSIRTSKSLYNTVHSTRCSSSGKDGSTHMTVSITGSLHGGI